jgi:hypothetical protein
MQAVRSVLWSGLTNGYAESYTVGYIEDVSGLTLVFRACLVCSYALGLF